MHVHAVIDTMYAGGAENLLLDFAAGARERGVETTVSYLAVDDTLALPRMRSLGIEPRPVDVRRLLARKSRRLVRAEIEEVGGDLVHTHLLSSDYLGSLAGRELGVPVVSTLHSAAFDGGPREKLRQTLVARARRRGAARVIAVSEAARKHYLSHGWERPERVVTVHNGILADAQTGAGPGIRAGLGIDPGALVVATVSLLRPGKGHDVAIKTVAAMRDRGVDAQLLILGEGPLRESISAALGPLGEHGQMLGHRDDVLAVLDAVDILIHPSSADAFPGALLEAMAASVPVVATDVGGIPEIVVPGETGFLAPVPPAVDGVLAPMMQLASDAGLRAQMGAAGRRRLDANFTVPRWMDRLLPLYEEVIAECG